MASVITSTNAGDETYTAMDKGDVDAVGKHCDYCRTLDWLPFRCNGCKGTFCLDHRSLDSHHCPKAKDFSGKTTPPLTNGTNTPSKPSLLNHDQQCSDPACKTLIYTHKDVGVHCSVCNRHYCLKHRMPEEHNCKNLIPIGARPQNAIQQQRDRGVIALRNLKAWADNKKASDIRLMMRPKTSLFASKKSQAATAERDRIMQLKKMAKGTASIAADKRVYLFVEASADTTKAKHPSGQFFYDKTTNVGRVLDIAAKALQVENVNNRGGGEEEKLRVFHVEGGRLLRFQEKIGEVCQTGNMIVIMRGVGDPDLIDLKD